MKTVIVIISLTSLVLSADITLLVSGIKADQGGIALVYLFTEKTWMKQKIPFKTVPVTSTLKAVTVNLENVYSGEYAIQVIHDRDGNGKLTMKWAPPGPVEGYGFSAGYEPTSIPKYKPARFQVVGDLVMPIKMSYPK